MGSTPLGVGAALSSSLPDRLLPRHVLPIRPGIRHRAVLPLFTITARRRRFFHASRRPLVFSPRDGGPRHRAAASSGFQGEQFFTVH